MLPEWEQHFVVPGGCQGQTFLQARGTKRRQPHVHRGARTPDSLTNTFILSLVRNRSRQMPPRLLRRTSEEPRTRMTPLCRQLGLEYPIFSVGFGAGLGPNLLQRCRLERLGYRVAVEPAA